MSPTNCANCDGPLTNYKPTHVPTGPQPQESMSSLCCSSCGSIWSAESLRRTHLFRKPVPPGSVLSMTYEPNNTSYNNVVCRVGSWVSRSDSYFFGFDDRKMGTVESLRAVLSRWQHDLSATAVGDTTTLLYALEDQGSGWLRCDRLSDAEFEITPGWSGIALYSLDAYPSATDKVAEQLRVLEVEPLRVSHAQLTSDIAASVDALVS